MTVLAVAVGGALGAVARYLATLALQASLQGTALANYPLATMAVNVVGAFALAWIVYAPGSPLPPVLRTALTAGFLGALTTFSTFEVELDGLWRAGRAWAGLAYLAGNLVLGYLAVLAGRALATA